MNTTTIWIISTVLVLAGYDIFAALRWGYHGTVSYDVLVTSLKYPIIPFISGVIAGHLFWPQ